MFAIPPEERRLQPRPARLALELQLRPIECAFVSGRGQPWADEAASEINGAAMETDGGLIESDGASIEIDGGQIETDGG